MSRVFQTALTMYDIKSSLNVDDIDADSAIGTSVITDDRSSCWLSDEGFSDEEEVSSN